MRSTIGQGVALLVALALPAASCFDSGHLIGNTRGSGGSAASGGTIGSGGSAASGGAIGSGGGAASGGAIGSGGGAASGGAIGSGGATGSGGMAAQATGGTSGTGGAAARGGSGGAMATGGANAGGSPASGGAIGSGGAGGAGGGPLACGGPSGTTCPTGQFCDLASNCGMIADAPGVCMPYGPNVTCSNQSVPVCGCEGRTYANDCQRAAAGMLKAMDGVCVDNVATYPSAYLSWQASLGASGSGPAAAVNAPDWLITFDSTGSFPPESPPANPTAMQPLNINDTDSLFLRLAGVNLGAIPHGSSPSSTCHGTLYFRLCKGCATNTVTYDAASELSPELELIWAWFDGFLGATAPTNPRNYCSP